MYVMLRYESDLSELQFGVCDPCSLFNTTCVVTKRRENFLIDLGPVVQKPVNANPRLKIHHGVYFSSRKCC